MAVQSFPTVLKDSVSIAVRLWVPAILGTIIFFLLNMVVQFIGGLGVLLPSTELQIAWGVIVFLLALAVGLFAAAYQSVLGIEHRKNVGAALQRAWSMIVPFIHVWCYIFLYSWGWLALAGFLIASFGAAVDATGTLSLLGTILGLIGVVLWIIKGPRYILATSPLLLENFTAKEAVMRTYERTKGYWSTIFFYYLGFIICLMLTVLVLFSALAALGMGSMLQMDTSAAAGLGMMAVTGIVSLVVGIVVVPILTIIAVVFLNQLYLTIKANPKK